MKLLDIKERAIILDYIPGAYGFFMARILNGMIYNQKSFNRTTDKNFHTNPIVPVIKHYDLVDFNQSLLYAPEYEINLSDTRPVFCPMHWSLTVENSGKSDNNQYLTTICEYKFLEIYFAYDNLLRYFLNWCFNIGPWTRKQIFDIDYFVDNFYNYCSTNQLIVLFNHNTKYDINTLPTYKFSLAEIIQLFELWYAGVYNDQCRHKIDKRCLSKLEIPNSVCSVEVNEFFQTIDGFVNTVVKIRDFFKLDFELDIEYLTAEWQDLKSIQISDRLLDFTVPDDKLHPIELGCRNVYRKQ